MNRPEPKFCVGELVEIQSKHFPKENGKRYFVIKIEWDEISRCASTGEYIYDSWAYILNDGFEIPWKESALRHPPKDEPTAWPELADIWIPSRDKVTQ